MKLTWKFWVIHLTLLSIVLILIVLKLIYDKARMDEFRTQAAEYIQVAEAESEILSDRLTEETWNSRTSPSFTNSQNLDKAFGLYERHLREIKRNVTELPWKLLKRGSLTRRKFEVISSQYKVLLLPQPKRRELERIRRNLTEFITVETHRVKVSASESRYMSAWPRAKFFEEKNKVFMANWLFYNDHVGSTSKDEYLEYVKLLSEDGVLNGYTSPESYWSHAIFEMEPQKLHGSIMRAWDQIKPLYEELHAYVRGELKFLYGSSSRIPDPRGIIPVHLVGLPMEDDWSTLFATTVPYPGARDLNITYELLLGRYSPESMAKVSDDFLNSLGLPLTPPSFWEDSIFERSAKDNMDCTPSLYDTDQGTRLRISLCGQVDEDTYVALNLLMIRSKFRSLLKGQPFFFRQEVTPAITRAVEETLLKFMSSPRHLQRLGLFEDFGGKDNASTINFLFGEALRVLPKIAQSLSLSQWQSDLYSKKSMRSKDSNCHWWKLRRDFEGLRPPEQRQRFQFDAAGSLRFLGNPTESLEPFLTDILKYNFFKIFCQMSKRVHPYDETEFSLAEVEGHGGGDPEPLHACDISGSSGVGNFLTQLFKLGSSRPWQTQYELLKEWTHLKPMNEKDPEEILWKDPLESDLNFDVSPFLEYFEPLYSFLKERNQKRETEVGWDAKSTSNVYCA